MKFARYVRNSVFHRLVFSRNVCDLSNPFDLHQVVLWAQERIDIGEAFHLWGSLPCTPWCSWRHLNEKILDEEFNEDLQNRREESRELVSNFSGLADLAIESGSATFEWPSFLYWMGGG